MQLDQAANVTTDWHNVFPHYCRTPVRRAGEGNHYQAILLQQQTHASFWSKGKSVKCFIWGKKQIISASPYPLLLQRFCCGTSKCAREGMVSLRLWYFKRTVAIKKHMPSTLHFWGNLLSFLQHPELSQRGRNQLIFSGGRGGQNDGNLLLCLTTKHVFENFRG